jgi:mannonate dehydratase
MAGNCRLARTQPTTQTGVPGLPSNYSVANDKLFYERAEKGLPPENVWFSEKYLLHVPKLFEALRLKHGNEIPLASRRASPVDSD